MRKVFLGIVCCVLVGVLSYRFYLARFLEEIGSEKKQIEVVSELEEITVSANEASLNEFLSRFNVWQEGVCVRGETNEEKLGQISKSFFRKIKIVLTYNCKSYKRDKVFLENVSGNELVSSAEEKIVDDDLIILLGFSKKFLDSLDNKNKEMYITQSFIRTFYRISHVGQNSKSREEGLNKILIEYVEANKSFFEIK